MNDPMERIRGVVIPADWDKDGNIISATLSGWDEVDYRIEGDMKADELQLFMHHAVEVCGEVRRNGKQNFVRIHEIRFTGKNDPRGADSFTLDRREKTA